VYSSPSLSGMIKSRRMRLSGHIARMGEKRNAYRILVGKPEGKRPLRTPRNRWEDNIKMDLYTQLLQSLMQLFVHQFYTSTAFSTSVFTLVQHVSATLGHHQALLLSLLKLSHCNLMLKYNTKMDLR
jgi:hypothetical protein